VVFTFNVMVETFLVDELACSLEVIDFHDLDHLRDVEQVVCGVVDGHYQVVDLELGHELLHKHPLPHTLSHHFHRNSIGYCPVGHTLLHTRQQPHTGHPHIPIHHTHFLPHTLHRHLHDVVDDSTLAHWHLPLHIRTNPHIHCCLQLHIHCCLQPHIDPLLSLAHRNYHIDIPPLVQHLLLHTQPQVPVQAPFLSPKLLSFKLRVRELFMGLVELFMELVEPI